MSKKLFAALTKCLELTDSVNASAKTGNGINYTHEDAVIQILRDSDFSEDTKENYPKLSKGLVKKWAESGNDELLVPVLEEMKKGSFIPQPSGSHGMPDLLIKDFTGQLYGWECKSGKNGTCPMWNDNLPKQNITYILMSGKRKESTVFLGKDVILDKADKFWANAGKEADAFYKMKEKEFIALGLDKYNRGWQQKCRKQHFQSQGGRTPRGKTKIEKVNYFNHADRKQCEQNALEYAKQ
jgi:hypothetical protein